MLTQNDERAVVSSGGPNTTYDSARVGAVAAAQRSRLARALNVEWLGQTVASLCWIASVFTYGISSSGDWLQLCAASAWLLANIASFSASEAE